MTFNGKIRDKCHIMDSLVNVIFGIIWYGKYSHTKEFMVMSYNGRRVLQIVNTKKINTIPYISTIHNCLTTSGYHILPIHIMDKLAGYG